MAGSLVPHKICLLVLIDIYCRDLVPPEGQLSVLSFLAAHLVPHGTLNPSARYSRAPAATATSLDSFRDLLHPLRDGSTNKNLWDCFLRDLASLSNLDRWHDYLENITRLFGPDDGVEDAVIAHPLAGPSLLGVAVRQAHLEFRKLDFHGVASKWQDFELFMAGNVAPLPQSSDDGDLETDTHVMDALSGGRIRSILGTYGHSSAEGHTPKIRADVERLLIFQIDQMQKLGNRLPEAMQTYLRSTLSQSQVSANLSNYAKFLDAWHAGDEKASFENLHRYYDYTLLNRDRSHYQYALLNTAILQADLGQRDEAVAAMQETISTARENKDMCCLNFSLSWLYHFRVIYGRPASRSAESHASDARSLAFLKAKAHENKMWSTASATTLNEARLFLCQGRRPLEAIEKVYESSALNTSQGVKTLHGAQLMLQSSLFGRLGIACLATGYRSLVPGPQQAEIPMEDVLSARCQNAFLMAAAGKTKGINASFEEMAKETADTLKHRRIVSIYNSLLKLKQCLCRNDLQTAEAVLSDLHKQATQDRDLAFQISLCEIDLRERQGEADRMLTLVDQLITANDVEGRGSGSADVSHRMRLLVRKCRAFGLAGQPQHGTSLVLRAIVAAMDAKAMLAVFEAAAALSEVLVALDEAQAAREVLDAVMWQAEESEDAALLGLLQSSYSSAAEACADQSRTGTTKVANLVTAVDWTKLAFESFRAVGDVCQQYALARQAARLLRALGRDEEARAQDEMAQTIANTGSTPTS